MSLFKTVPSNFFSVLSSKNKELYADALVLLYKLFRHELNIEKSEFVSALINLLEGRAYELEEDDDVSDGSLTLSAKAGLILSRFVKTGWVDREYLDGSFIEVITPRGYAIQAMKLLYDLDEMRVHEYSSLVFSTYSSLKQAQDDQNMHMYEAIVNAKTNADKLVYELKTLYHGIRSYLRKIQGQNDVNVLLSDHFDEYKHLADRIYHPIKTMDSVYRYMAPIRSILMDVMGDDELMEQLRKRAMTVRRYESEEQADTEITSSIDHVLDIYGSIGGIVNEIDRKHSSYTKLSVDSIRYQMTADQTIAGKLATLLKLYSESENEKRDMITEILNRGVNAGRQDFFDGRSLWHKNVRSRRSISEPLQASSADMLSDKDVEWLMANMDGGYSLQKIKAYMNRLFGVYDSISTDSIELKDDDEFLLLLLSTIRAGERNAGFNVRVDDGGRYSNGYRIPVMTFTRKKGAGHVE